MFVEINIKNYDITVITNRYYTCDFETTCSFDTVKESFINKMDLVNTITDFNKSKLYFFINNKFVHPNRKILDFISNDSHFLFVIALYDFDNNFSLSNTFIWISNIKIGDYYMFCPKNMTISEVKSKYKKYVESFSVISNKMLFVYSGNYVYDNDTIEKYSETSKYAVFVAKIF